MNIFPTLSLLTIKHTTSICPFDVVYRSNHPNDYEVYHTFNVCDLIPFTSGTNEDKSFSKGRNDIKPQARN